MKRKLYLKNSLNSKNYRVGTRFEITKAVRIKLNYKDLIILAGILVAAIITVTFLIVDSGLTEADVRSNLPALIKSSPSPTVLIQKLGQSFFNR